MTEPMPARTEPAPGRAGPMPATAGAAAALARIARRAVLLLVLVLFVLAAPLALLSAWLLQAFGPRERVARARRMQRVSAAAFRGLHDALDAARLVRFDHRGALAPAPRGPCVVVANHPTRLDFTALTAALGGGFTVVKPAHFRRPWLAALMRGCRHVEGPGDDPLAAGRVVDEAVERLQQGLTLIIFPEGTRSPARGMLPFGRTAFEIACRARVPVLSVAVRCDPPWLTKQRGLLDPPHRAPRLSLQILATDHPAGVDFDSRALRQHVEARFRSLAGESEAGAAPRGTPAP